MAFSVASLKTYIENDFNVLLQGKHGVGKTEMLRQACDDLDLDVKYYSASTLDPFTDLVGIPVPKEIDGIEVLTNIRPRSIDNAEVLFFDELNRAETKTLNAVFEIIQFHTINGEPLPKLKCVIGAQNPPNDEYTVASLDPALVDRFHLVLDVPTEPSQSYLSSKLGPDVAAALVDWWRERKQKSDYISPRKLEQIGHIFSKVPKKEAVKAAMPPGGTWNYGALYDRLQSAVGNGTGVDIDFATTEAAYIRNQASPSKVSTWFDGKTTEQRSNVVQSLASGVGIDALVEKWEPVLHKFSGEDWEALVTSWGPSKRSTMRMKAKQIKGTNADLADTILNVLS